MSVHDVSPRRVRRDEEDELVAVEREIASARQRLDELLNRRDQLIAELLDDNARAADVADILGLSVPAVYHARNRARKR